MRLNMTINCDLKKFVLTDKLPEEVIKDYKRALSLYNSLDELKVSVKESLTEQIKNSNMTIEECAELMKVLHISREVDIELMGKIAQKIETSANILRLFTAGLHYRKEKDYGGLIAKELLNLKKKMPHKTWIEILRHKDPWYFRISFSIEKVVLVKTFETAPGDQTIVDICNEYYKKGHFSISTIESALSSSELSIETWKELREQLTKREEIKKIAKEKINQYRTTKNHRIHQT